jgi:hypothetical protein
MELRGDQRVAEATFVWMQSHGLKLNCPLCKSGTWNVGMICEMPERTAALLAEMGLPVEKEPGRNFQVIPIVCAKCAYTAFIAAAPVMDADQLRPHGPTPPRG